MEQDTCASVDEPRGGISLTDQPAESVGAELLPKERQSQVDEMVFSAGDHELKVVIHVENIGGSRSGAAEQAAQTGK